MAEKKTARKLVPARKAKQKWSPEDDAYLQDKWGANSIKTIAKNLGRSENAVIVRAQRLGCGAFLDAGVYVALNQILVELYGGNNGTGYARDRLINKYGLPVKEKVVKRCRFKVVDIEEFWKWAEKNKSILDFSKMHPYCFGAEPDWVKLKRNNDKRRSWQLVPHNTPWTTSDDQKLRRLLKANRYTYTDLSREFRRTEGAIKRRMTTLQIKEKPIRREIKPWTDEEVDQLLDMLYQGFTYSQIGEKLGRSDMAVRGKYERLLNPNYMRRYNRGHSKDYDYVGIRDVSPTEIKKERKDMVAMKGSQFFEVDELPGEEMIV